MKVRLLNIPSGDQLLVVGEASQGGWSTDRPVKLKLLWGEPIQSTHVTRYILLRTWCYVFKVHIVLMPTRLTETHFLHLRQVALAGLRMPLNRNLRSWISQQLWLHVFRIACLCFHSSFCQTSHCFISTELALSSCFTIPRSWFAIETPLVFNFKHIPDLI